MGLVLEMHRRGKTIIFSTHQLEQVEELCQDIVIIGVLMYGQRPGLRQLAKLVRMK